MILVGYRDELIYVESKVPNILTKQDGSIRNNCNVEKNTTSILLIELAWSVVY